MHQPCPDRKPPFPSPLHYLLLLPLLLLSLDILFCLTLNNKQSIDNSHLAKRSVLSDSCQRYHERHRVLTQLLLQYTNQSPDPSISGLIRTPAHNMSEPLSKVDSAVQGLSSSPPKEAAKGHRRASSSAAGVFNINDLGMCRLPFLADRMARNNANTLQRLKELSSRSHQRPKSWDGKRSGSRDRCVFRGC